MLPRGASPGTSFSCFFEPSARDRLADFSGPFFSFSGVSFFGDLARTGYARWDISPSNTKSRPAKSSRPKLPKRLSFASIAADTATAAGLLHSKSADSNASARFLLARNAAAAFSKSDAISATWIFTASECSLRKPATALPCMPAAIACSSLKRRTFASREETFSK